MLRKIILIFSLMFSFTYAVDEIDVEKRRQEQQNFDDLIRNQNFDIQKGLENEGQKNLILNISSIDLEGNTIFENFQIEAFLRKYIEDNKDIYALINELENKYIEKGYVTTRIRLNTEKSDFEKGKISLFVLEGKIAKVFYDNKENKFKTFITFPRRENDVLNIRDLDQGIDNLGDNSKMDIKASDKDNYSNIYIKRDNKPISFGVNYNDLGQFDTSRHRLRYFLNTHNIFGLNESLDFSYQNKLQRQYKERDTKNFSFGVSVPFKYWTFSYNYDSSQYLRSIPALGRTYKATGNTENQTFGIRKMLHRNENHKIDIGAKIILKDSKNYIDDVRLVSSSRKLSVLTVDTTYTGRIFSGLLNTNLGVSFGLKRFAANNDSEEWYREEYTPKAQFRKYNMNISWYKPMNNFYYKTNIVGQYSKDILYSQEKIGIGDDTTVRGFKDESTQGDKGFYIRNEIGYKGNQFLEPYIAYDYGRVFNNKVNEDKVETLQGVVIGIKGYFKGFEGSFALAKPIDKPSYFRNNKPVAYTSITYRF